MDDLDVMLKLLDYADEGLTWSSILLGEVWVTAEGKRLEPRVMGRGHLQNALAWLRRHAPGLKDRVDLYCLTLPHVEPRGEMAQMYYEQEQDELFEETPQEWIEYQPLTRALEDELEHRMKVKRGEA